MAMTDQQEIFSQRISILEKIENRLELPMLVLSFVWLVLMIVEFTIGLSPFLVRVNHFIWMLFLLDFSVRFLLAPAKLKFLTESWVTALALLLPAFRLFRVFRAAKIMQLSRASRTLKLARVLTSLNRGITALGKSLSRRGFGYVLALTLIVLLAGAAGMLSFENEHGRIIDYGTALWWTAMTLTTMGSDYFPESSEGRLLCLLLATYGFAIFGYVTASVATFFVGRDAENSESEIAGQASLEDLNRKIQELNSKIDVLISEKQKSHNLT